MKDIRQSKEYAKYLSSIGWKVRNLNNNYYFIKKLFFLTTIKLQRPEDLRHKDIRDLSKKQKGFVNFIIEPIENIKLQNFRQTQPYLPSKTSITDLKKSEEGIYRSFSKDAKYSIKKSAKLKIETCED